MYHTSIPCPSHVAMVILPVGDSLEGLLKRDVVKSGDGLSLGLSPHMMKFFTMEGPFIGLYYDVLSVLCGECMYIICCTCTIIKLGLINTVQSIYMYVYKYRLTSKSAYLLLVGSQWRMLLRFGIFYVVVIYHDWLPLPLSLLLELIREHILWCCGLHYLSQ